MFEVWNGQEDTPPAQWSDWYTLDAPAGYSGRLQSTQGLNGSAQVVVTIRSRTAIGQLVYDFDASPTGDYRDDRYMYFNFAARDRPLPEPGTLGLALIGAVAAAAARRRRAG